MSVIVDLAKRQLDAYNAASLEAFVACYHDDVRVFHGEELSIEGKALFRERYRTLFTEWRFGAEVPQRLNLGSHCIDYERWWRIDPESGQRSEGELLVRYHERDGVIAVVQFLS
tara:strand:+ start:349 stop:690 length:342 start_codon:yes stop_codon:yes gene_type:complete